MKLKNLKLETFLRSALSAAFLVSALSACAKKFAETAQDFDGLAVEGYTHDKYQVAVDNFDLAVLKEPKEALYYWKRARSCLRLPRLDQALADTDKAISLIRDDQKELLPYFYHTRGEANRALNYNDDAITDYTRAIELVGNELQSAPFYHDRGCTYLKMGKNKEALKDLNKAVEIVPTSGRSLYWRGKVYEALQEPDKAAKDFQNAELMGYVLADDKYEPKPIDM